MSSEPESFPESNPDSPSDGEGTNQAGNRRGMSAASRANLRRGDQSGEGNGEKPAPAFAPLGPGLQQLVDMRHVYERPASEDRTPGQKMCRKWAKENLSAFMAQKTALENRVLAAREKAEGDADRMPTRPQIGNRLQAFCGFTSMENLIERLVLPEVEDGDKNPGWDLPHFARADGIDFAASIQRAIEAGVAAYKAGLTVGDGLRDLDARIEEAEGRWKPPKDDPNWEWYWRWCNDLTVEANRILDDRAAAAETGVRG
jgi:hypothetical protein